MSKAADFRERARNALREKWVIAILVGFVVNLLGGALDVGPKVSLQYNTYGLEGKVSLAGMTIFSTQTGIGPTRMAFVLGGVTVAMLIGLIFYVLYFALGAIIEVGYAKFNLNLVDGWEASFENIFAYFSDWLTMVKAKILRSLYTFLWGLLLIIPGVIASLNYSMTDYILAEHPELSASEALRRSKEMMRGNRWRLFCLNFSFIGWIILFTVTMGIGFLWLRPYMNAATAAFYREISGTEEAAEEAEEWY